MESRGLDYTEGDLGPVYGFQWRHFGEEYQGKDKEYKGWYRSNKADNPFIKNGTYKQKNYIILESVDLDKTSLPPCHVMTQFNVDGYYLDVGYINVR